MEVSHPEEIETFSFTTFLELVKSLSTGCGLECPSLWENNKRTQRFLP